jgi:hypothetical protein
LSVSHDLRKMIPRRSLALLSFIRGYRKQARSLLLFARVRASELYSNYVVSLAD